MDNAPDFGLIALIALVVLAFIGGLIIADAIYSAMHDFNATRLDRL